MYTALKMIADFKRSCNGKAKPMPPEIVRGPVMQPYCLLFLETRNLHHTTKEHAPTEELLCIFGTYPIMILLSSNSAAADEVQPFLPQTNFLPRNLGLPGVFGG